MKQLTSIMGAILLATMMAAAAMAADEATPAPADSAATPADPTVEESTLTKPGQPLYLFRGTLVATAASSTVQSPRSSS